MTLGQYLNHLIMEADGESNDLSDLLVEKSRIKQESLANHFAETERHSYTNETEGYGLDKDTTAASLSLSTPTDKLQLDDSLDAERESDLASLQSALLDLARHDDETSSPPLAEQSASAMSSKSSFASDESLYADEYDLGIEDLEVTTNHLSDPQDEDQEPGAFASAKSMMVLISHRLENIESELKRGPSSHWTQRIEGIEDQVGRSESHMVGGLLAVEKALKKLDNRAETLEKNQGSAKQLGHVVEHLAGHFTRFEASTSHKLDTIADIISEIDGRVSGLETGATTISPDHLSEKQELIDPISARSPNRQQTASTTWSDDDLIDDFDDDIEDDFHSLGIGDEETSAPKRSEQAFGSNTFDESDAGTTSVPSISASSEKSTNVAFTPNESSDVKSDKPESALDLRTDEEREKYNKEKRILEAFLRGEDPEDLEIDEMKYTQPGLQRPKVLSEFRASTIGIVGASILAIAGAGYLVLFDQGPSVVEPSYEATSVDEPIVDVADEAEESLRLKDVVTLHPESEKLSVPSETISEGVPPQAGSSSEPVVDAQTSTTRQPEITESGSVVDSLPPSVLALATVSQLEEKAKEGDPNAQLFLGIKQLSGADVPRDEARGAALISEAAASGSAPAQYRLGALYEQGVGVDQDYAEAKSWYEMAALSGNRKAMHNLAVLYAEGKGVKQDYSKAAEWFNRAANLDLTDSQYNLGILLKRGYGVEKDPLQAYKWFEIASRKGDKAAEEQIVSLKEELEPKTLEEATLLAQSWKPQSVNDQSNFDRFF